MPRGLGCFCFLLLGLKWKLDRELLIFFFRVNSGEREVGRGRVGWLEGRETHLARRKASYIGLQLRWS